MSGQIIRPALWDTPGDSEVSVSLDIGVIPHGSAIGGGKHIITIQVWPLPDRKTADTIADALREAIGARLGVKMQKQTGHG